MFLKNVQQRVMKLKSSKFNVQSFHGSTPLSRRHSLVIGLDKMVDLVATLADLMNPSFPGWTSTIRPKGH